MNTTDMARERSVANGVRDAHTGSPHAERGGTQDDAHVALLRELVEIESLSGQEARAVRYLVERGQALGLRSHIDAAGNAVLEAGAAPGPGVHDLVLLGHIDTVPGHVPVREEGGVLFGRGTVDAKGPLCAFVCAAAGLDLPANVRVVVIGAVEEECPTSKGARFAATQYRPRACIIGEPSGLAGVTLGYKGRLIATARARVDAAHSAGPNPTASEIAVRWWDAARRLSEAAGADHARVFDQVRARLRSIHSCSDGVTDEAAAGVSFRLPPAITPHDWEQRLRALPESGALALTFAGHESAHASDCSDAVARALSGAIRSHGLAPVPKLKTGTSDMNVVAPVWRCPIAAYGPGDSALDHTPMEHIVIDEYLRSIRVLRHAIRSLACELAAPAPA